MLECPSENEAYEINEFCMLKRQWFKTVSPIKWLENEQWTVKKYLWSESASELYRQNDRHLSAK
jgi:hypothetical protein